MGIGDRLTRAARREGRLWLCVPPLAAAVADLVITLSLQPAGFWATGRRTIRLVREGAPHGRWLMLQHPAAFVAGGIALLLLYALLVVALPRRYALVASVAIAMAHTSAAGSWMRMLFPPSTAYWVRHAAFVPVAALIVWAIERSMRAPTSE